MFACVLLVDIFVDISNIEKNLLLVFTNAHCRIYFVENTMIASSTIWYVLVAHAKAYHADFWCFLIAFFRPKTYFFIAK